MAIKKTQQDLVNEVTMRRVPEVTEKIMFPGVLSLHTKSIEEIATTLATILKSRQNIKSIFYKLGEYIELTSDSDMAI